MRKWSTMNDVYIKNVQSWAYAKTVPNLCTQYLGVKTGVWFDANQNYIICNGEVKVNTKKHTARCEKCETEWTDVGYKIFVDDKAECPFCGTPDPLWEKDHSKHTEDKIDITCPKCHNEYFISIWIKHFVEPIW